MIRDSFFNEINELFSKVSCFGQNDFSVEVDNKSRKSKFSIVYRYNKTYKYVCEISQEKSMNESYITFDVIVSPGTINQTEEFKYSAKFSLTESISSWIYRIDDELKSTPLSRQIREQKQQLEEFLEKFDTLSEDYFTIEEADDVKARLDDLEARLEENLRSSIENQQELEKRIESLQSDVNKLKIDLDRFNKKGWWLAVGVKFFDWVKVPANQKMLTQGAQAASDLLLGTEHHHGNNSQ